MKTALIPLFLLLICFDAQAQSNDALRLNQIQIIGSHNSYKKFLDPRVMKFLNKYKKQLGHANNPDYLDYNHLPFDSQFTDYHMRGLEIDIHNDPKGGAYYRRRVNAFVHGMPVKSHVEELKKPGFKVLHIKDVDYQTNYYTFKESIIAVKNWSEAHPNHLPILINLETKTEGPGDAKALLRFLGFKRSIPFDASACDSIDAEIKAVFSNDLKNILTPDKLRGKYNSLEEMVKQNGWPSLDECRGKIIFIMLGGAKATYVKDHPSLRGRAACVYSSPGKPECAFIMQDDPIHDSTNIVALVKQGYIVRTRSDAETREARTNDTRPLKAAMITGAQIISTDYYKPDLRLSNFTVQWEGGHVGKVNPICGPVDKQGWLKE